MELSNRQKWVIATGMVLVIVFMIWTGIQRPRSDLPKLDPYNYQSVGLHFTYETGAIVRRLGKIERHEVVGDGGGSGRVSFNVYKLYGTENIGVCEFTLSRQKDDTWVATDALLTIKGMEYRIPMKGLKARKVLKIFK
ncbi:hypothetical protein LLG96_01835 [bacterium]|nr:hypothetical protein [bacterium]